MLNYALVLEYLQAAFYTEAERAKALTGRTAKAAKVVGAVERAHVKAFRDLLGRKAVGEPHFDFQGVTENNDAFLKTAVAFEDLAVAAYKGQARADPLARGADVGARDPHRRGAARRLDALPQRQHARGRRVRPPEARGSEINAIVASTKFITRQPAEHERARAALHGVSRRRRDRPRARGRDGRGRRRHRRERRRGPGGGAAAGARCAAPAAPGARDPAAAAAQRRPGAHPLGARPPRRRRPRTRPAAARASWRASPG